MKLRFFILACLQIASDLQGNQPKQTTRCAALTSPIPDNLASHPHSSNYQHPRTFHASTHAQTVHHYHHHHHHIDVTATMPPIERDAPRDMDKALRHQHSASSDQGSRALVIPMWDSSDPERAPPPLPLNPQSPGVVSRAGTSSAIQSAHAALTEKARESAMVPHIPKRMNDRDSSPEKSLLRGSQHRRMQSLQPASVKDYGMMIEAGRESNSSTPRSSEKTDRPSTPSRSRDPFVEPRDEKDDRGLIASPRLGPSLTPIIRPSVRRPHSSILGENTPPQSATMLALQNMGNYSSNSNSHNTPIAKEPETPLANITNASTALVRAPQSLEVLSNQILTLTNIATTLQKEMSQLSRRSRDNATDLLSLKEATNSRDEDIRKSLRELISDAKAKMSTRDQYGGPLMLEGRYHSTSPTALSKSAPRPFSLPRIPSPNSFAASLDRESSMSTPSLYGSDSPAIIALLEKILREMGTREGQDSLLAQLTELSRKLSGMAGADKVDELVRLVKSNQQQAVVPAAGGNGGDGGGNNRDRGWSFEEDDEAPHRREINYNRNGSIPARGGRLLPDTDGHHSPIPPAHAAEVLNEDVIKAIRTVKDSVAQGGGLTAEVKALVRELRGEVLGMGREIGRRLDEVAAKGTEKPEGASNAEMTKVVEEGLEEMKQHMNNLLREHRRQSLESVGSRETTVDYKEIYNSMRAALKDSQANKPRVPELRREDVFQAVKDAWEKYKPEIEIQQIGLERDEVLECLQEGLRAYAPRDDRPPAATKDEVFKAVVEGLKHFVPPQVDIPATLSRDEILEAVRECLEEFEFPVPPPTGPEITKDDMLDAVKEGLHTFDFPTPPPPPPPGPELTREDMLDAVNEGLHTFDFAAIHSAALVPVPQTLSKGDVSDAVKQGLKSLDLSDDMLEAVREGVHSLNLTNDMAHAVKEGLESFDFASTYSSALVPRSELSRVDVVDAVKEGLESIDVSSDVEHAVAKGLQSFDFAATYSSALVPHSDISRVDVVDAVKEGLGDLSSNVANGVKEGLQSFDFSSIPALQTSSALVPTSPNSDEVVQRLLEIRDYLEIEFKAVSEEAKQNIAASGRDTEQVLDATKDGFEKLRQDIEVYVDRARGDSDQEEFMAHLVSTLDSFRVEIAELVAKTSDSSKALVREEIESLRDTVNSSLVPAIPHGGTPKEIIEAMQEGFGGLRSEISTRPIAGLTEILDALQEGLGDIRTSIDKLSAKPADLTANDEILDALKSGLDGVKSEIDVLREESRNDQALAHIGDAATAMVATESVLKHDDIKNLEVLISQLGNKVEALESAPPPVIEALSKEDLTDMEDLLRNVAGSVAGLSSREPLEPLEDMLRNIQESVAGMAAREPPPPPEPLSTDAATREDVEAIENILRNTKARLEDLIEGEQAVRKDHIDTLETLMLEARESITGLSSQVEILSSKEDVTMVESLVTQIISSFDEMKERHEKALEDPEKVTKTDIDAIEAVCHDTKNVIEQIVKADLATLPTKEDLQGLENLLAEFRERIDSHASSTAKAFEERQAETVGVSDRVIEVKSVLEQFRDIVGNKLEDGAKGIDTMNAILDNLGDIIRKNANISDDLKEMFETMKEEFDESRAGVVGAKLEADDKFQITTDTLVAKLDERMGELFAKYDEFQQMQEDRAAKGEERDAEMEAAVIGTKAIAEELKTLIDTLGTAVTDSMEKMEEASRTVFDRVEDLVSKAEENHNDGKVDHQLTRDTVQEAIGKVDGLQGHVAEFQPKILETLQEVISLVGQHYEHAKTSADVIQQTMHLHSSRPSTRSMRKLRIPQQSSQSSLLPRLSVLRMSMRTGRRAFKRRSSLLSGAWRRRSKWKRMWLVSEKRSRV
ncbi:hypothetical protein B0T19DRAFT_245058 [Cercophora scortea]|uniref:Transport protein USO1 n=1 Tax=Cercophora scortea TaxID=314031 RepID=A0AAE0M7E0_9PEZI|nr:hypothetical protein B0T19DRAFT_245058 [Cercophora scortea]